MPRRVSLPGAAELFRQTQEDDAPGGPDPATGPTADHAPLPDNDAPDSTERDADTETRPAPAAAKEPGPAAASDPPPTSDPPPDDHSAADAVDPAVAEPADGEQPPAQPEPAGAGGRRGAASTGRVKHDEKITVYISSNELLDLERARLTLRAEHGMAVDRGRIVREALALMLDDLADNGAASQLVNRLSQP